MDLNPNITREGKTKYLKWALFHISWHWKEAETTYFSLNISSCTKIQRERRTKVRIWGKLPAEIIPKYLRIFLPWLQQVEGTGNVLSNPSSFRKLLQIFHSLFIHFSWSRCILNNVSLNQSLMINLHLNLKARKLKKLRQY